MKRRISYSLPAVLILATGILPSSCIYEGEGYCPAGLPFTIVNNWQAAPDANPGGMAYIFFPNDGSVPWRYDFPGRNAGQIDMDIGEYRFLSYNDDTYNVRFQDDGGYYSYKAYTDNSDLLGTIPKQERGATQPSGTGEPVRACPDMMWGCAYCFFSLDYSGVRFVASGTDAAACVTEFSPDHVLTASQRQLTPRYSFRIEDIKNLSGVKSISAALSGMAGGMMLASGEKTDYPSTLSLKAAILDDTAVGGNFYTFGIPAHPLADNILSLFVVIKDGRRVCYEFDVTDRVRTAPDPLDVYIVVKGSGIELPEPEDGGDSAFDVSVDGWETVVVNIED